jgi:hypothetical protein
VVDLRKRLADEHRQPNEKQTSQVRNDAHCDGLHGVISFI